MSYRGEYVRVLDKFIKDPHALVGLLLIRSFIYLSCAANHLFILLSPMAMSVLKLYNINKTISIYNVSQNHEKSSAGFEASLMYCHID